MPCYHPIQAWYSKTENEGGKRSLVFNRNQALQKDDPVTIGCGRCIGCRLEKSKQWATRCVHEASMYEDNCFITLTFSTASLKKRDNQWSLDVRDFQLFMKRLRKKYGAKIKFFHCGEYGDENKRPHYHACLFNFDFPDKILWKEGEHKLYISPSLTKLWPEGFSTIGSCTFESAAYVARYVMKKIYGEKADEHYQWIDADTGEIKPLKPEYITMSRNPGIGQKWFHKYYKEVYPADAVIINGHKCTPPKYYDGLLEKHYGQEYDEIKSNRFNRNDQNHKDLTPDRMAVREKIHILKAEQLKRNHDERYHNA